MKRGDALTAFDPDVGRRQRQRAQRLHKMQFEFPLALGFRRRGVIEDFEKIDPVQCRMVANA
jgi:hypothetical protein